MAATAAPPAPAAAATATIKLGGTAIKPPYDIHGDVGEVLFTKEQLQTRTAALGREIGAAYQGKRPLLMPILKGGFICEPCRL